LVSLNLKECYLSEEQKSLILNYVFYKNLQGFKLSSFIFSFKRDLLAKFILIKKISLNYKEFTLSDLKEMILSMKNKDFKMQ